MVSKHDQNKQRLSNSQDKHQFIGQVSDARMEFEKRGSGTSIWLKIIMFTKCGNFRMRFLRTHTHTLGKNPRYLCWVVEFGVLHKKLNIWKCWGLLRMLSFLYSNYLNGSNHFATPCNSLETRWIGLHAGRCTITRWDNRPASQPGSFRLHYDPPEIDQ